MSLNSGSDREVADHHKIDCHYRLSNQSRVAITKQLAQNVPPLPRLIRRQAPCLKVARCSTVQGTMIAAGRSSQINGHYFLVMFILSLFRGTNPLIPTQHAVPVYGVLKLRFGSEVRLWRWLLIIPHSFGKSDFSNRAGNTVNGHRTGQRFKGFYLSTYTRIRQARMTRSCVE